MAFVNALKHDTGARQTPFRWLVCELATFGIGARIGYVFQSWQLNASNHVQQQPEGLRGHLAPAGGGDLTQVHQVLAAVDLINQRSQSVAIGIGLIGRVALREFVAEFAKALESRAR